MHSFTTKTIEIILYLNLNELYVYGYRYDTSFHLTSVHIIITDMPEINK